jgi:hypothetical protein
MTIDTPSDTEAEGSVAAGPEHNEQPSLPKELLSLGALRGRLIEKLFIPSRGDNSWMSLPATN